MIIVWFEVCVLSLVLLDYGYCKDCHAQQFWNDVEDNCPDTFFRMGIKDASRQENRFFFHMLNKKVIQNLPDRVLESQTYATNYEPDDVSRYARDSSCNGGEYNDTEIVEERYLPFQNLFQALFSPTSSLYPIDTSIQFPDSIQFPGFNQNGYSNQNYPQNNYPQTNYPNSNYPSNNGWNGNNNYYPANPGPYKGNHDVYNGNPSYISPKPAGSDQCVNLKNRIVGGSPITIYDAPYQVLYDDRCGGAILSEDWVITAAHCEDRGTYIRAGFTDRAQAPRYEICQHHIHPKWKRSIHPFDFDFQSIVKKPSRILSEDKTCAGDVQPGSPTTTLIIQDSKGLHTLKINIIPLLLLLRKPLILSQSVVPIAIGKDSDLRTGAMAYVTGWGYVKENGNYMVKQLRGVDVPVISNSECRKVPTQLYQVTDRMFCAGYPSGGKDACQGDSGGPVIINRRLMGLVSFGTGCARAGRPGVYSRLTKARDWVTRITSIKY